MFINVRRTGDTATLSAAIRSDDNEDFGRFTSWRLTALTETGFDGVAFKAALGTGFRAPSPYEVGSNQSPFALPEARDNPLKEEQSEGWEMGLRGTQRSVARAYLFRSRSERCHHLQLQPCLVCRRLSSGTGHKRIQWYRSISFLDTRRRLNALMFCH